MFCKTEASVFLLLNFRTRVVSERPSVELIYFKNR
jgi:hypothetical protein